MDKNEDELNYEVEIDDEDELPDIDVVDHSDSINKFLCSNKLLSEWANIHKVGCNKDIKPIVADSADVEKVGVYDDVIVSNNQESMQKGTSKVMENPCGTNIKNFQSKASCIGISESIDLKMNMENTNIEMPQSCKISDNKVECSNEMKVYINDSTDVENVEVGGDVIVSNDQELIQRESSKVMEDPCGTDETNFQIKSSCIETVGSLDYKMNMENTDVEMTDCGEIIEKKIECNDEFIDNITNSANDEKVRVDTSVLVTNNQEEISEVMEKSCRTDVTNFQIKSSCTEIAESINSKIIMVNTDVEMTVCSEIIENEVDYNNEMKANVNDSTDVEKACADEIVSNNQELMQGETSKVTEFSCGIDVANNHMKSSSAEIAEGIDFKISMQNTDVEMTESSEISENKVYCNKDMKDDALNSTDVEKVEVVGNAIVSNNQQSIEEETSKVMEHPCETGTINFLMKPGYMENSEKHNAPLCFENVEKCQDSLLSKILSNDANIPVSEANSVIITESDCLKLYQSQQITANSSEDPKDTTNSNIESLPFHENINHNVIDTLSESVGSKGENAMDVEESIVNKNNNIALTFCLALQKVNIKEEPLDTEESCAKDASFILKPVKQETSADYENSNNINASGETCFVRNDPNSDVKLESSIDVKEEILFDDIVPPVETEFQDLPKKYPHDRTKAKEKLKMSDTSSMETNATEIDDASSIIDKSLSIVKASASTSSPDKKLSIVEDCSSTTGRERSLSIVELSSASTSPKRSPSIDAKQRKTAVKHVQKNVVSQFPSQVL